MKQITYKFLLLVLFIQSGLGSALAFDGEFRFGRVEVHPSFGVEMQYIDNIFYNTNRVFPNGIIEEPQPDFIYSNEPGLNIKLERKQGDWFGFDLNYKGQDERFFELKDQDIFKHDIFGSFNLGGFGGRSDVTLGGRHFITRSPVSPEFATNLNPRADREESEGFGNFEYMVSKNFKTGLLSSLYRNQFKDENNSFQSSDKIKIGTFLTWNFTPITSLDFEFTHQIINYHEISSLNFDSNGNTFLLSVMWEPTRLFDAKLGWGFSNKDYHGIVDQDRDEFIYKIELNYRPTQRTRIRLASNRELRESSLDDIQSRMLTNLNIIWFQKFWTKWNSQVKVEYQHNSYDELALDNRFGDVRRYRSDDYVSTGLNLVYNIQKWLQAQLDFSHQRNMSNFLAAEYVRNSLSLKLTTKF